MSGNAVGKPTGSRAVTHRGISPHRIGAMVQRYWYL